MQRLRERSFQAVLMDLNLPDSSGLETFFKIQAEGLPSADRGLDGCG